MPIGTLELPQEMISAAEAYAARENRTVADLFADMMGSRYGFRMTVSVVRPEKVSSAKRTLSVDPRVRALRGVLKLPKGVSYDSALRDALGEKYGA